MLKTIHDIEVQQKRSPVLKKIIVISVFLLALSMGSAFAQKTNTAESGANSTISFELRSKPLKLVGEEIFQQTGYKIVFDEKWNGLILTGQYKKVRLEEFFLRAFREQNVSTYYNDKEKVVVLRFFGDRKFDNMTSASLEREEVIEPVSGLTKAEITEMHESQRVVMENLLNDPNAVEPVTGMTRAELSTLHESQRVELESLRNDPSAVDPVTGMTNAEIKDLGERHRVELVKLQNDPSAVDPVTGTTKAEINQLHARQQVELDNYLNNPNVVEPVTGMTRAELKNLHERQRLELKKL
jgi:hypothetical protein